MALIRTLVCSEQWVLKRFLTGQSAENKSLLKAQSDMKYHSLHSSGSRKDQGMRRRKMRRMGEVLETEFKQDHAVMNTQQL